MIGILSTAFRFAGLAIASTVIGQLSAAPTIPVDPTYRDDERIAALLRAPAGLYTGVVAIRSATDTAAFRCTGIAVRQDWIATMADCLRSGDDVVNAIDLTVLWGSKDITKASRTAVTQFVMSPESTESNGIALLHLAQPIEVKPVEIVGREPSQKSGVVVGWGKLSHFNPATTPAPHQVHLTVDLIETDACRRLYRGQVQGYEVADHEFCARSRFEGVDACAGFAGAPIFTAIDAARRRLSGGPAFGVLGLASWGGEPCGDKNRPTVYEGIAKYNAWIDGVVGQAGGTALRLLRQPKPVVSSWPQRLAQPLATSEARKFAPLDPYRATIAGRQSAKTDGLNVAGGGLLFTVSISHSHLPTLFGHFCGGVIVGRETVLTAAHCVDEVKNTPRKIKVKLDSGGDLEAPGVPARVTQIKVHEKYNATPFGSSLNDVALLKLDRLAPANAVPAVIPGERTATALINLQERGFVVGWGENAFSRYSRLNRFLLWKDLNFVPNEICRGADKYGALVDSTMLCAGDGRIDACQGDSGGPLLVANEMEEFIVVGLVSWGAGCGEAKLPGVYVRLSRFTDWIARGVAEFEGVQTGTNMHDRRANGARQRAARVLTSAARGAR